MSKICPKSSYSSFYFEIMLFKIVQTSPNFWATFVRKFVVKNFKKNCPIWSRCSRTCQKNKNLAKILKTLEMG